MIYICYGVTKSASTYLYQLTEEILRVAKRKPARLGPPFRHATSLDNYLDVIDPDVLAGIEGQTGGGDVVLKTHGVLDAEIARRIEAGVILASVSIRDPREIALSMLDHGRRSRRWGFVEFSEFNRLSDTFPALDEQFKRFEAWSALRGALVFNYNEVCFDTPSVVASVAAQIGVAVDAAAVLEPFRSNRGIGQFSKGAALRYREMSRADQDAFVTRYAALYRSMTFDTPFACEAARRQNEAALRPRGQMAQVFAQLYRQLRR